MPSCPLVTGVVGLFNYYVWRGPQSYGTHGPRTACRMNSPPSTMWVLVTRLDGRHPLLNRDTGLHCSFRVVVSHVLVPGLMTGMAFLEPCAVVASHPRRGVSRTQNPCLAVGVSHFSGGSTRPLAEPQGGWGKRRDRLATLQPP